MTDDELFARFSATFDPADWLADVVGDYFGAPAEVLAPALPPMAGGQIPGLDDARDFFGGLWGRATDVGDQLGRFIADAFAGLWDDFIWPLLGGTVRWVWDGLVWIGTGVSNLIRDTGENVLIGSRWLVDWLWDRTSDMGSNILTGVSWTGDWLWDRTRDMGSNILTGVSWTGDWLWDRTRDMGSNILHGVSWTGDWLWDQVSDMGGNIITGARLVGEWVWDRTRDMGANILQGITWTAEWLLDNTRNAVMAGAQLIATPFQLAFDWLRSNLVDPIIDSFETKIGIPGRLFRGEYGSLEEIWDDILDPLPAALGGLGIALLMPLTLALLISSITATVMQPLLEPAQQRMQARIGSGLPATGQILEGRNRGLIDAGNMQAWLRRLGFGPEQLELYEGLRHELPSPSDLIRFAVREVFDPVLSQQLSLYDDFPERFAQIMEFKGFGPSAVGPETARGPLPGRSWAEAFWAAHWDLPSPTQGFQMLHRQVRFGDDGHVFNEQDLRLLLRALDVAPVWREPLTQIAYNPITRVDIRRMYAAGILTYDQVVARYQHLGYTRPDAVVLANFAVSLAEPEVDDPFERQRKELTDVIRRAYKRRTIDRVEAQDRLVEAGFTDAEADFALAVDDVYLAVNPLDEADPGTRELTASTIVKAYRLGLFDRPAAQRELEIIGYQPGRADLLLALEDFARSQELTDLQIDVVRERYLSNSIPREQAVQELEAIGVVGARQFEALMRWDLQRRRATRRLTPTQTLQAWERGIFDDDQVFTELQALGYSERDAQVLIRLRLPDDET